MCYDLSLSVTLKTSDFEGDLETLAPTRPHTQPSNQIPFHFLLPHSLLPSVTIPHPSSRPPPFPKDSPDSLALPFSFPPPLSSSSHLLRYRLSLLSERLSRPHFSLFPLLLLPVLVPIHVSLRISPFTPFTPSSPVNLPSLPCCNHICLSIPSTHPFLISRFPPVGYRCSTTLPRHATFRVHLLPPSLWNPLYFAVIPSTPSPSPSGFCRGSTSQLNLNPPLYPRCTTTSSSFLFPPFCKSSTPLYLSLSQITNSTR